MKYKKLYSTIVIFLAFSVVNISFTPSINTSTKILIYTDLGDITIKLYNETPLHRNNFIQLIKEQQYDNTLFHRVIKNFVIQGGNPNSKNAAANSIIEDAEPSNTIPAEINQQFFHKKGALAASRKPDFENPDKSSSGSQFYIVQGSVYKKAMLDRTANRITKTKLFNEVISRTENDSLRKKYKDYSLSNRLDSLKTINAFIMKQVDAELPKVSPYVFSDEQIKAYTSIGGSPHLDNSYTVFGEVVEGLNIIDVIAEQAVDNNGRPLMDIKIKVRIVN